MILDVETLEKYMGQDVKDPYGRIVGRIVGIYSDVDGKVESVEIRVNEFEFHTVPAERIVLDSGGLVIYPAWKSEANKAIKQIERAKRRLKALEDLYSKGEIPRHAYMEFKNKVESQVKKLSEVSKAVREMINRRIYELEDQVTKIERALTAVKMSYIAGEIGERAYKTSADMLRLARDKNLEEKKDARRTLEKLQKVLEEPVGVEPKKETVSGEEHAEEKAPVAQQGETPIFVQVIEGET